MLFSCFLVQQMHDAQEMLRVLLDALQSRFENEKETKVSDNTCIDSYVCTVVCMYCVYVRFLLFTG